MKDKRLREMLYNTSDQELTFTKEDRNAVFEQIHTSEKNTKMKSFVSSSKRFAPLTVSLLVVSLCIFLFIPSILPGLTGTEDNDQASEKNYELNKIVATLNGRDITIRDIISQFPITDVNIENYLKQEIIIDEAKNTGITVSKEYIKELKEIAYPNAASIGVEKFNAKEADALGLTNDEYVDLWASTHLERNKYFQTYIKTKFDEPTSNKEVDKWGKEIESYINTLYENYIENKVLIIH